MIQTRNAGDRGHVNLGWLDSYHSFSFGSYFDPAHMGFRKLRVINEDRVVPGGGFPTHPHRDMEILTYVIDGALEHRDSMGNGSVIRRGDIQRMTAGTGVTHSEYNHSGSEPVHFLQIWIETEATGLEPDYEQANYLDHARRGRLQKIVSRGGGDGAVHVNQEVSLYRAEISAEDVIVWPADTGRHTWIQVVRGELRVNDEDLGAGDGVAISHGGDLRITTAHSAEFLLFDLN